MRRSTRTRGLALAAGLLAAAPAAALDPTRPLSDALVDAWGRREGLPNLGISAIAQGADGYLWLGTEAGLVRFDGLRFVVYDTGTTPVLRSSRIQGVLPQEDGTLLVATFDGLYRVKGERWEAIACETGAKRFTSLLRDPSGRILAVHPEGVVAIEGARATPLPIREQDGGSTTIAVRAMAIDAAGSLWLMADNGKRLLRWDGKDGAAEEDPLTAESPAVVTAIASDRQGAVWLAAKPGGLMRRAGDRFVPVPVSSALGAVEITRLVIDRDGSAWLGTLDGTVARVRDGRTDILPASERLFGGAEIRTIAPDVEGSVWVASSGLYRLRDAAVVTLSEREGWPAGAIASVFADSRGDLWVGPQSGGLFRRRNGAWKRMTEGLPEPVNVLSTTEDRSGTVWFGTTGQGLYWVDERDGLHLAAAERKRDGVGALSPAAAQRTVLAGMTSGFWTVDADHAIESPFVREGEVDPAVFSTYVDRKGRIFAGTTGKGIFVRESAAAPWKAVEPERIGHLLVLGFAEDEDGTIWAGTVDGGLLRIRGLAVASLKQREGLPSDTVYAVIVGDGDDLAAAGAEVACEQGDLRTLARAIDALDGDERARCRRWMRQDGTSAKGGLYRAFAERSSWLCLLVVPRGW
jgi:ligand-binding sensor domain-containing protein